MFFSDTVSSSCPVETCALFFLAWNMRLVFLMCVYVYVYLCFPLPGRKLESSVIFQLEFQFRLMIVAT